MGMLGDVTEGLYEGLLPSYAARKQKRQSEADMVESARILSEMGDAAVPAQGVEGEPGYVPAKEATGVYVGMAPEKVPQAQYTQKILAATSSPTALRWAMKQRSDQMNTRATGVNQRMLARENASLKPPVDNRTTGIKELEYDEAREGTPLLDRKRAAAEAGASSTNVFGPKLEFEKSKLSSKSNQTRYDARLVERNMFQDMRSGAREMQALSKEAYVGKGASIIQNINEYASAIGVQLPGFAKDASKGAQMVKLAKGMALKMAENLKGSMSEKDLKFVVEGAQNINDPRELFAYIEKRSNMLYEYKKRVIDYMGDDYSDKAQQRAEARLRKEGYEPFSKNYKSQIKRDYDKMMAEKKG